MSAFKFGAGATLGALAVALPTVAAIRLVAYYAFIRPSLPWWAK